MALKTPGHATIREQSPRFRLSSLFTKFSGTQPPSDEEMRVQDNFEDAEASMKALMSMLNCSLEDLRQSPGIKATIQHLERQFDSLNALFLDHPLDALAVKNTRFSAGVWNAFRKASLSIQALQEDASLEDLWTAMAEQAGGPEMLAMSKESYQGAMSIAFAMVCWNTMLFLPSFEPPSLAVQALAGQVALYPQRFDMARRPLFKVFASFTASSPKIFQQGSTVNEEESILHASSINYFALKTFCYIRISWVQTLSEHLLFDPVERRLSVFALPSALLLALANEPEKCALRNRIFEEVFSDNNNTLMSSKLKFKQLIQEIFMTYRVIFGQERNSRRLFSSGMGRDFDWDENSDSLLRLLCASKNGAQIQSISSEMWPQSCRDFQGRLLEGDTYSIQDEFPLLGMRLRKLYAFSMRQQPRRIRDIWRDRRDPLQWYTFWAVLIIGGISLLLTTLQVIIAAIQLAIAIRAT